MKMKILAMGKSVFDKLMIEKGITPNNVEQQDKLLFISINTNGEIVTESDRPFFPEDKANVKVMHFSDVEKDTLVPLIGWSGEAEEFLALAMTKAQAVDLYSFIKDNIKGKEAVLIHCTAGISRSGAVASFIHDYLSGDWESFKIDNPQIQPNAHVYGLLHDCWYKDLEFPDGWTEEKEEKFKIEVINPLTTNQLIALYNNEHPDQHTTLEYLTKEEIKEKYCNEMVDDFCNAVNNTPGLPPDQKASAKYKQELIDDRFPIIDNPDSFVNKIRPSQILYNRLMAGASLTEFTENEIADLKEVMKQANIEFPTLK